MLDITRLLTDEREPPKRCEPDANGWVPHGPCFAHRRDGQLLLEITYTHGIAHGPYRAFWSDGRLATEGQYANGFQQGEWRFYPDIQGNPVMVLQFTDGQEVVDWKALFGFDSPPRLNCGSS